MDCDVSRRWASASNAINSCAEFLLRKNTYIAGLPVSHSASFAGRNGRGQAFEFFRSKTVPSSKKIAIRENSGMVDPPSGPESESEICIDCGFCCDGTLFDHALAGPGDTPESLITIGLAPIDDSLVDKSGFQLPCPHFTGLCSIYASPRPWACGAFRCRLLRSFANGMYTATQARQIVREAKAMREALLPVLDAMYADAVAVADRADTPGKSLISRLRTVIPILFRPEAARQREKYGKLLLTAMHLASHLTNHFLPKSLTSRPGPSREKEQDSRIHKMPR